VPAVLDLFLELAAIPSPPGEERAVADRVIEELRALGLEVDEDGTGREIGSTAGSLLARIPATTEGLPIFLCAHLDTVPPEGPIEPAVEDGVVRNTGGTILGADNKAAVAVMVEGVRRLLEERTPHAAVELLFTQKEEVGLLGAYAFDCERLQARHGFVYDQGAPIGEIVLRAPYAVALDVTFHGQSAHAGMAPEEGRSAIAAAARAVADLRLGRIDEETSANVGTISGGSARNVVPDRCALLVEARSHDERKLAELVQEMNETCAFAASLEECRVETTMERSYRGYRFGREDTPVQLARSALEREGFEPRFVVSGGAADANVFNERGLACVNLANGMAAIHSPEEHIAVADLEAMVEVTLGLLEAARRESA
jgi:tripeptide aminopeptidase